MPEYDEKYDATGLNCPLPIMRVKHVLSAMETGKVLYIISTDPGSIRDFQAFCNQTGHELLNSYETDENYHYYIRKMKD